jgi:hypothetical protein
MTPPLANQPATRSGGKDGEQVVLPFRGGNFIGIIGFSKKKRINDKYSAKELL